MGDLNEEFALALATRLLWTAVYVCVPILGFSMLVGLVVSVLQAVTQVQEASIAFVLKILTVAIILLIFGPWMLGQITGFARTLISNIPAYF
jgi:flagellar biosynthetic protein FliQ